LRSANVTFSIFEKLAANALFFCVGLRLMVLVLFLFAIQTSINRPFGELHASKQFYCD
jgi:hypothetical protein